LYRSSICFSERFRENEKNEDGRPGGAACGGGAGLVAYSRRRVHFAKSMYEEEAIAIAVRNSNAAMKAASKPLEEKTIANAVRNSSCLGRPKLEGCVEGSASKAAF